MKRTVFLLPVFLFLTMIIVGCCYRMPTEDDFSVVPTTNNPDVTCEKPQQIMPKIGY